MGTMHGSEIGSLVVLFSVYISFVQIDIRLLALSLRC